MVYEMKIFYERNGPFYIVIIWNQAVLHQKMAKYETSPRLGPKIYNILLYNWNFTPTKIVHEPIGTPWVSKEEEYPKVPIH